MVAPSIFAQDPKTLSEFLAAAGEPRFRQQQVCHWLFEKRLFNPDAMSNLPKKTRENLKAAFSWEFPELVSRLDSPDGASKLLLKDPQGRLYESVILRYEGRVSLCVSSQVGCKLACRFCQTGKLGFFRHLSCAEIIGQFALAQSFVASEGRNITHVVFMGMGEPLDNFSAVKDAVSLLTGASAYGLSSRRVTVSTSGIADKIIPLAEQVRFALAVSLHACRDELRDELMPINKRFPLATLKNSLLAYQKLTGNLVTIEYILIKDKNSDLRHAKDLVSYLHGLRAKVNLIPFNAHPGLPYERPDDATIRSFQAHLAERGYPAPVRYSKGLAVSAACGQLAAKNTSSLDLQPERRRVLWSEQPAAPSTVPAS